MIRATAPTRVDLAGGTLDIWPVCHLLTKPACTVNVALDRRAGAEVSARDDGHVRLRSLDRALDVSYPATVPEHDRFPLASRLVEAVLPGTGIEVVVRSTVPPGSGLGGSSALAVAIGAALTRHAREEIAAEEFLSFIRNLETRLLGLPAGYQDYYPALYGGVQTLVATLAGVERRGHPEAEPWLARTLLVADTRLEHHSGMNNWEVVRGFLDGDRDVIAAMNRINECAYAMDAAIARRDLARAGQALDAEWQARRTLAPVVSNERIEALLAAARGAGALAGKVCGAGGGGCLALLAEPERHDAVRAAIEAEGGGVIDAGIDGQGLRIEDG